MDDHALPVYGDLYGGQRVGNGVAMIALDSDFPVYCIVWRDIVSMYEGLTSSGINDDLLRVEPVNGAMVENSLLSIGDRPLSRIAEPGAFLWAVVGHMTLGVAIKTFDVLVAGPLVRRPVAAGSLWGPGCLGGWGLLRPRNGWPRICGAQIGPMTRLSASWTGTCGQTVRLGVTLWSGFKIVLC